MKHKIPHLILAGLFGTTLASQAATVVYQSDFTGVAPTLADVGLVKSAGAASGSWIIDAANDQLDGVGSGNGRSNVSTIDSWQSNVGFTLDVTFRWTDDTPIRFDFGLVDAAYTISGSNAWLSAALAGAYGVGFSSTIGATDGLFFNNGGDPATVSTLSTAQGDIATTTQTFTMTITGTTWSYSLNGAPATSGTHTFDTSRSYRFTAHAQSNDQATFDNITVTDNIPEPNVAALLGGLGAILLLRRGRV